MSPESKRESKTKPNIEPKSLRCDGESADAPPAYHLPLRCKANEKLKTFAVTRELFAIWQEAFPLVDVRAELKKIKSWLVSNPKKRPASDMPRFVDSWLKGQQNAMAGRESRASPPIRAPVKSFAQQAEDSAFDEFRRLAAMEETRESAAL